MFRPVLLTAALLAIPAFAASTFAADAQHATGRQVQPTRKTDVPSKVTTYNPSEEDNAIISQGYSVNGTIYISGQYSHDMQGAIVGGSDFEAQVRQTLENLDRVLAGFSVTKSNIAELGIYLTNPREQSELLAPLLKEYVGDHRPAATVIGVTGLWFPQQLLEIRAVAHAD